MIRSIETLVLFLLLLFVVLVFLGCIENALEKLSIHFGADFLSVHTHTHTHQNKQCLRFNKISGSVLVRIKLHVSLNIRTLCHFYIIEFEA